MNLALLCMVVWLQSAVNVDDYLDHMVLISIIKRKRFGRLLQWKAVADESVDVDSSTFNQANGTGIDVLHAPRHMDR